MAAFLLTPSGLVFLVLGWAFARLLLLLGIAYVLLVATAIFWHMLTRNRRRLTEAAQPRGQM